MAATEAFAPAKLNLTLHVTGQRADGYHLLDSLVVFADVGDRLTLTPGPAMRIDLSGPFAAGVPTDARNLVWRAAEAAAWCGHIALEKNLPHGAGIGGGSSDAAAVLRAVPGGGAGTDVALSLGADVPVCLSGAPQRMQGVGEVLSPVPDVPALDLVFINPGVHLPTPDVFRAMHRRDNPAMDACGAWSDRGAFLRWLLDQRNDLQEPACGIAPTIRDALAALKDAELSRMSGSGATCFGIYPDEVAAKTAAQEIAARHPGWWVVATRTSASPKVS